MGRCRLQWRGRAGLWGAATTEREAFRAPDNRPASWMSSETVANIDQNYSERVTTKVQSSGDYFVLSFFPHKNVDFSCFQSFNVFFFQNIVAMMSRCWKRKARLTVWKLSQGNNKYVKMQILPAVWWSRSIPAESKPWLQEAQKLDYIQQ